MLCQSLLMLTALSLSHHEQQHWFSPSLFCKLAAHPAVRSAQTISASVTDLKHAGQKSMWAEVCKYYLSTVRGTASCCLELSSPSSRLSRQLSWWLSTWVQCFKVAQALSGLLQLQPPASQTDTLCLPSGTGPISPWPQNQHHPASEGKSRC